MKSLLPCVCVAALVASASISVAQGGAAGYGQKAGGGGGVGGGRMGAPNQSESYQAPSDRPDDDQSPGLWTRKTAILTPGDRVEYKVKLKAGETIFAGMSSDAFDPALSLEDSAGKELVKNDDREEGDQSPFLVYRAATEGDFTLKVLSFHSVAGGKFMLRLRTIAANEAAVGPAVHPLLSPIRKDYSDRFVFRLTATKGRFYDFGKFFLKKNHGYIYTEINQLIGPTGVRANDYERLPTPDGTFVFLALATGDYYIEFRFGNSGPLNDVETDFQEISATPIAPSSKLTFDMGPAELRVFEMPIKPDLLVHTTITGAAASILGLPDSQAESLSDRGYDTSTQESWYKKNVDSTDDIVRVFHVQGVARFVVRSVSGRSDKVTIENEDKLPVWNPGAPTKDSIEIGDSFLYTLSSTKSELMQVLAEASHFQLRMEIFRLNGELANVLIRRRSHTVGDNLYFPDAGTFLIRISCDGNGGSGDFSLKRDTIAATPYALGKADSVQLSGDDFGLYSADLVAGRRYELVTDSAGRYLRVDLLDEDGQFLTSTGVTFDKVEVQYFVPTRSGRHRLWLRGNPGTYHFRFQAHVPPSVDGTPDV